MRTKDTAYQQATNNHKTQVGRDMHAEPRDAKDAAGCNNQFDTHKEQEQRQTVIEQPEGFFHDVEYKVQRPHAQDSGGVAGNDDERFVADS